METLKMMIRDVDGDEYFSDEELRFYLDRNDGDLEDTAYELLLIKAEDDSCKLPNGIEVKSREQYWLRLASRYRKFNSRVF